MQFSPPAPWLPPPVEPPDAVKRHVVSTGVPAWDPGPRERPASRAEGGSISPDEVQSSGGLGDRRLSAELVDQRLEALVRALQDAQKGMLSFAADKNAEVLRLRHENEHLRMQLTVGVHTVCSDQFSWPAPPIKSPGSPRAWDGGSPVPGLVGHRNSAGSSVGSAILPMPMEEPPGLPVALCRNTFSAAKARATGNSRRTSLFSHVEDMKEKVREHIVKPTFHVEDLYHERGVWQAVATSQAAEYITLFMVGLNAVWIAIDTDANQSDTLLEAPAIFQVMEHAFTTFFTVELFVRFMAFRKKINCLRDPWFIFDGALVIMMVLETWILTIIFASLQATRAPGALKLFRLVRLTRIARVARLMRAMPELVILMKAIFTAARSVFFTLCLLLVIIYIFAVFFTQVSRGTEMETRYFSSVSASIRMLLVVGAFPDLGLVLDAILKESFFYWVIMLAFVLLTTLTVMNMLVGVLVEVVSAVATAEKEALTVGFVKSQMADLFTETGLDVDGDGAISRVEFESILEKPRACHALQSVGVDVVGLVDLTDFIFEGENSSLDFPTFMDTVLALRGSNMATVRDLVVLRKYIARPIRQIQQEIDRLQEHLGVQKESRPTSMCHTSTLKRQKSIFFWRGEA